MGYRNINIQDKTTECLVCKGEVWNNEDLVCSVTCQDVLDVRGVERTDPWNYDDEEVRYA